MRDSFVEGVGVSGSGAQIFPVEVSRVSRVLFAKFLSRLGKREFSPRLRRARYINESKKYNTISVRILDARRGPRNTLADSHGIVTRAEKLKACPLADMIS